MPVTNPVTESMVDATNNILLSRADLRIKALASLQLNDGRKQNQWNGIPNVVSPDGRYACFLFGPGNCQLAIWDIDKEGAGQILTEAKLLGSSAMSFHPDGRRLGFVSAPQPITIWDIEKNKFDEDISLSGKTLGPIAFSPDGKLLAWVLKSTVDTVSAIS